MYSIEIKKYGLLLVTSGFIPVEEMSKWKLELESKLESVKGGFGVFADMGFLKTLPTESQQILVEGQIKCKEKGMARSAVIVDNHITKMQCQRLAKETGIYSYERYISGVDTNW